MVMKLMIAGFTRSALVAFWLVLGSASSILTGLAQDGGTKESQESEAPPTTGQATAPGQDGQEDLNSAFEKKITARSERDLREVVELCDSAIAKGLPEDSARQARELKVSALMEGAEELASRIFSLEPDPRWRVFRGRATQMLDQALEVSPENYNAWLLLAKLHVMPGGDSDRAKAAIEKAVEFAGESPKKLSMALMVRSATAGEDRDARLADLGKAIEADAENLDAKKARGALYMEMGQPEKAIADFEAWLNVESGNVDAWLIVVAALEQKELHDEALRLLDRAIEANADSSLLYSSRSRIRTAKEEFEGALADAQKATALDADNVDGWFQQCTLFMQQDRFDEALAAVNKVLEKNEFDVRGKWIRSLILASQEKFGESMKDLRWLTANIPEETQFQMQMAMVLTADKKPRKALEVYGPLIEDDGTNSQALRGRGDTYLSLGMHREALEDYQAALEHAPEDSGLLNNLAWLLATSTFDELRDGKRSIEYGLKACELTEYKAAHILSTLASGYAETGDFENARKWAEKAVELAETDEQRKGLQEELDSYRMDKPWREIENVEEEAGESPKTGGDGSAAEPPADGKTDPEKKDGDGQNQH